MSHPRATIAAMGITSLDFGSAARALGRAARLRDLVVPVFASPPSRRDLDRAIRRRNGSPILAARPAAGARPPACGIWSCRCSPALRPAETSTGPSAAATDRRSCRCVSRAGPGVRCWPT